MTQQLVDALGLFGFFLASFLAATVVPLALEAIVPVMVTQGFSSTGLVATGTIGGWLGSLVNYWIGREGGSRLERRTSGRLRSAARWLHEHFDRFGTPLLLFSWLPVVGELITLAGGVANARLVLFSFWTILGRALRILGLIHLSLWIF